MKKELKTVDELPLITSLNKVYDKTNIFMIHAAAGNSECYAFLANTLKSHYSCYGVNSHNINNKDKISTAKELAAQYLSEIKKIMTQSKQDHYYLLGWSFGGRMALEIASLLEKEDSNIGITVYVLDSFIYDDQLRVWCDDKYLELLEVRFREDYALFNYSKAEIDKLVSTLKLDISMYKAEVSQTLSRSKIFLFKAMLRNPTHIHEEEIRFFEYINNLPYNNLDTVTKNLSQIELIKLPNVHHYNIFNLNSFFAKYIIEQSLKQKEAKSKF